MACCGYGGPPLNFDKRIDCGQTKILDVTPVRARGCNDSSKHLHWDGYHYTEASNRYIFSTNTLWKLTSSVCLRQSITTHHYLVRKHLASLRHDVPVQRHVKFSTPKIASLDVGKEGKRTQINEAVLVCGMDPEFCLLFGRQMGTRLSFCKILITFLIYRSLAFSIDFNYPAVFNFGDSNSDTGGYVAGLPYHLYPPNGQIYFNGPAGSGRNGSSFLNPYLDAIGAPSFAQGCNFGLFCTILPATATSPTPYSYGQQVAQFFRFKARVLILQATTKSLDKYLPASDYFEMGLYMFDIGQNDLTIAFNHSSFDQVLAFIPRILSDFEEGVKVNFFNLKCEAMLTNRQSKQPLRFDKKWNAYRKELENKDKPIPDTLAKHIFDHIKLRGSLSIDEPLTKADLEYRKIIPCKPIPKDPSVDL
ncbi:hypothetical protein RJ640_002170 [Escallonia rubra]|uniref:GDSL esterase/lipase n=1 Tax=Escallonia rubra TaxID=112253 RepID=A0AA88QU06_9ASTE|nr:hypothetical protein RJ640_002170 [Escallonia rubra]